MAAKDPNRGHYRDPIPELQTMTKRQPQFAMELTLSINKMTGRVSAAYFYIRRGKSAQVKEFAEGRAFADYDRKGQLLGIELLAPCEIKVLDRIASKEPIAIKNFLRGSAPREMVTV
jgi:uncharacterized protein YuzE